MKEIEDVMSLPLITSEMVNEFNIQPFKVIISAKTVYLYVILLTVDCFLIKNLIKVNVIIMLNETVDSSC